MTEVTEAVGKTLKREVAGGMLLFLGLLTLWLFLLAAPEDVKIYEGIYTNLMYALLTWSGLAFGLDALSKQVLK